MMFTELMNIKFDLFVNNKGNKKVYEINYKIQVRIKKIISN